MYFLILHHLDLKIWEPYLAELQDLFRSTIVHWPACTKQSMFFLFVKFAPLAPENIREPHFAQLQFFFFFKSTTVHTLICMQKTINSFNFKNLHHLSENIREPHLADLQFFLFKSTIVHWSACTKQSMVFIWKICTKCTWKYQGALFSRPAKAFQKLKLGLPTYFFAQWPQQLREKLAN